MTVVRGAWTRISSWVGGVDVLDGIRNLKLSKSVRADEELRNRVYELINLSNNMPKH
ncbi:hypothetical protein OAI86_05275 [Alphaproteobacteria bacterium]|nr:hypothetical protein [Alphaproteobacteria bacterium]